jgi:hypothetical protein
MSNPRPLPDDCDGPGCPPEAQGQVLMRLYEMLNMQMAELHVARQRVDDRLREGDERFERLAEDLRTLDAKLDEIRDIFGTAQAGFRVLGWLGSGLKLLLGIGAAGVGLWAAWKQLGLPPPK